MAVSQTVSEFHIGFRKRGSETDINGVAKPNRRGFRSETEKVKPCKTLKVSMFIRQKHGFTFFPEIGS